METKLGVLNLEPRGILNLWSYMQNCVYVCVVQLYRQKYHSFLRIFQSDFWHQKGHQPPEYIYYEVNKAAYSEFLTCLGLFQGSRRSLSNFVLFLPKGSFPLKLHKVFGPTESVSTPANHRLGNYPTWVSIWEWMPSKRNECQRLHQERQKKGCPSNEEWSLREEENQTTLSRKYKERRLAMSNMDGRSGKRKIRKRLQKWLGHLQWSGKNRKLIVLFAFLDK